MRDKVKKTVAGVLACVAVACAAAGAAMVRNVSPAAADGTQYDYSAENWSNLPSDDWTKNDKGNTSEQSVEYVPSYKELKLTGGGGSVTSATGSAYLSSIFLINPGVTDYTDFTFTLTFRASYWLNESRWFGVMYRMQTDGDGLPGGYIFTNRMNTQSSYTANAGKVIPGVTGNDNGFKDTNHSVAKNPFTDGKYHTVTITMQGDTATHYVDGKRIGTAVTSDKDAIVGGHSSGGFALLVSQSSINIKSCTISRNVVAPEAEAQPQEVPVAEDYSVTDFSGIANNDWSVSKMSDYSNTFTRINERGELVVKAENAADTSYFGGMLKINDGAVYKDFTFEMEFKVTPRSWQNVDRWLGVVYRANWEHGGTASTASAYNNVGSEAGYIMQYRVSGKNAYSAVNKTRAFRDDDIIETNGTLADGVTAPPVLTDGAYHKITVVMSGNAAKHYIDGKLIRTAETAVKDGHLGTAYASGGFSLIVNAMEISIKSCSVTSQVKDTVNSPMIDDVIVSTYRDPDVKIINAPTVVCDVTDADVLTSMEAIAKPSNAIIRFDKNANVTAENGSVIDSFTNVYEKLNHEIIPVVYVADEDAADALVSYLNDTLNILDLAVMSDDPALVKKVRAACPRIRGVVKYEENDFYTNGKLDLYGNIVGKTNANLANTALIPQSMATAENVRYIQARFKTVWVYADSAKNSDLYSCVNSGAYGVVAPDYGAVYTVLESYPEHSYTRASYNVAHRGSFAATDVPAAYPTENSLGAVNEALALGVSHLELDGHLTKDGRIVIMHDTTIDRTTTGTGSIGDMTLEQIRGYKLKDGQEIPVLEDVFAVLEQHKDVVLVLELKAGATIAEKINELIGTGAGRYDVLDQLVIITFNNSGDDLLTDIKTVMPTVPTAYLLSGNGPSTFVYDLASTGYYNCGLDMGYNGDVASASYNKSYLTDRGISNWYWTFSTLFAVTEAAELGHTGITNNAAGVLMKTPCSVAGVSGQKSETLQAGDTVNAQITLYDGSTRTVAAKVFYCEKTDNYWNVFASYSFTNANSHEMTLFTPLFVVGDKSYGVETPEKPEKPETPEKPEQTPDVDTGNVGDGGVTGGSEGNGMSAGAVTAIAVSSAAVAAALGAGGTVLFMKKKNKNRK